MKHFKIVKPLSDYEGYVASQDDIAHMLDTDQTGECVLYLIMYHALCEGFYLPPGVVELIQNNRGVLVIDYTLETMMESPDMYVHNARYQDFINIRNQIRKYQLPADRVIVITGNLKLESQPEFRVINECLWRWTAPSTNQQTKHEIVRDIALRKPRQHKFMCLMRRPNDSRTTFAYQAFRQGFREHGLITSWFNSQPGHQFYYPRERVEQWSSRVGQSHDPHSVIKFYMSLPWMYDFEPGQEMTENPNCITRGKQYDLFRNSYVNVVHETFYYHQQNQLFLSEKSFKSVNMLQPFLVFGHPGTLEWMRSQGYYTFGDWWDESYDGETNDDVRYQKLLDIVKWISEQSLEYLSDMLADQLYVLQENHANYARHKQERYQPMWSKVKSMVDHLLD